MTMGPGLIGVMAKIPEPGRVKTRLHPLVPPKDASRLADRMLADTLRVTAKVDSARAVLAVESSAFLPDLGFETWLQGEGDLGQRMERILRRALDLGSWSLVIGTDTPHLPAALLDRAVRELEKNPAVIGPADDGGFYLLGLRRCPKGLLADLPWSSARTFDHTVTRLKSVDLPPAILPPLFDIDRPEDLVRLKLELDRGAYVAPATHRFLNERRPG